MEVNGCENSARSLLKEAAPNSDKSIRQNVAREMCRLLESGKLRRDLEEHQENPSVNLEYLVSRLEIREGADNPNLKMKWNHWIGEMEFLYGGYDKYKV